LNERTPSDAPGVRILLDRCLAACAAAPALGFRCLRLSVSLDTLAALAAQSLRLVRERAACCGSTLLLQSLGREEPVLLCSTHRRSQLDPCHRAGACCRSCLRDSSDETVLPSRDGPSLNSRLS